MKQYLDVLRHVLEDGEKMMDRTGTGCLQLFGDTTMTFDLQEGFPLLTTKKMATKNIIRELLWFLSGSTNVNVLKEEGCHIWDGNYENFKKRRFAGDLGPIYGEQWRRWPDIEVGFWSTERGQGYEITRNTTIDQIQELVDSIKNNPHSRRHIVSAWNVAQLDEMALPPCHVMFQCHVRNDEYLDLKMYQRSADMFLGVPFNIASYAMLLMMLAQQTGLKPGRFYHVLGNAHIYLNHIEQVREQLSREPKALPTMRIDKAKYIDSYKLEDFHLNEYEPWPAIKGEMSV